MIWSLKNLVRLIGRMTVEQNGATATEYAVILGLILVVVIAGATLCGVHFTGTTSAFSALGNGADPLGSTGPGQFRPQPTVSHP